MSSTSVTAVVPTTGRSTLRAAVQSIIDQTAPVKEILVVADTREALDLPTDERIRVVRIGPGAGGNVARQRGVDEASGAIVGLLDDDDEWLPEKIELQLKAVADLKDEPWIAVCRLRATFGDGSTAIWPDVPKGDSEGLGEYLFARKKLRGGHGLVQSSTLLFPAALARKTRFDPTLPFHQDIGWLMDLVVAEPQLIVRQVWEPLVVFNVRLGTLSRSITVPGSINWARRRLGVISSRLVGDFILTQTMNVARQHISMSEALTVLGAGIRFGRPSVLAVVHGLSVSGEIMLRRIARLLRHRD